MMLAEFVHQCIAHPLLFMSRDAWWAAWLHGYTARIAWPEQHHAGAR